MCAHNPQHARGKCPDMTPPELHDFTATPEAGLPEKLPAKKPRNSYRRAG